MDRPCAFSLLAALLVGAAGCSSAEELPEEPNDDIIPELPVPAANGPKLVVVRHRLLVRDRPAMSGKVLGTLRAGAQVARAEEPYSTRGCAGGWYPIRPRGFVCAGEGASTDTQSSVAIALAAGPQLDRALPYRYAQIARGAAVAYGALPSAEAQAEAEPKLKRYGKSSKNGEPLGTGANDVPLGESGLPGGLPVLAPNGQGVGEDGRRTAASWFSFGEGLTLEPGTALDPAAAATRVLKRHSGVAIAHTATVGQRVFGVMPDGRFIPTDRLKPALGTSWHGVDVSKIGLPVAFAIRRGIRAYEMGKGKAIASEDDFEPREPIPLTGRFRTLAGQRYYFTRDDQWVRHRDIILINKRNKYPDFVTAETKWVDISLANQTMVAWQGKKPLLATLISSGKDRLGDPKEAPSTIQGTFRVRSKHVTQNVDDREVGQSYSVTEVPWALEFAEGFSLTGCYWHGTMGEARSYHNVALAPVDAHWLWQWNDTEVPEGWHSVQLDEQAEATSMVVHIHK
jgi:hypothetical protein